MAEEETPLQNQIKFFKPQLSLSSIYIQDFWELISNVIYKDNEEMNELIFQYNDCSQTDTFLKNADKSDYSAFGDFDDMALSIF